MASSAHGACRTPDGTPARPHGQPHPADPAATRSGRPVPAAGDLITADVSVQPGGGTLPVPIGDEQGAPALTGARHHRPGPRRRHRPATKAENHQIHSVHQDRSHLHWVGARFRDDRDPTQVGTHLHRGEQSDVGLADDRHVSALGRHRRNQAQLQRSSPRKHRNGATRQRIGKQFCQRIGYRQQRIRSRRKRGRRGNRSARPSAPAYLARDRRHLAAKLFYLLSTRDRTPVQALGCRHSSTFHTIRPIRCSKLCSIRPVNTPPPTASTRSGPVNADNVE